MDANDPRHGSYRGWAQHRRDKDPEMECMPCHEARLRFQRTRGKLHKLGRPPRVPLGATAHRKLVALQEAGCSHYEMHDATGLSASQCKAMLLGGPRHIAQRKNRDTLRLLNVEDYLNHRLTHIGMVRRARALQRIGYSCTMIAMHAGLCEEAVKEIARGTRHSRHATRRAIARAYDELCMRPLDGTHDRFISRTINKARRLGYAPPLAWDNIDRDLAPSGVGDECAATDRLELLLELHEMGMGRAEVAHRFGIRDSALWRWCKRHGHLNVWEAMAS